MEEIKETVEVPEVSMTEKAVKEVVRIMAENKIPEDYCLRVGVKGGGCSGLTYTLGFDSEKKDADRVFQLEGFNLNVDWKSILYLKGTVIDFSDGLTGKGFVFINPTATRTCGCGSSFGV